MPSSSKTPTIELSQYAATDKPKRADFNEDYARIDDAIKSLNLSKAPLLSTPTPYTQLWNDSSLPVETGTWTPTFGGVSTPGTSTYTVQAGRYYKIGSLVCAWARVQGTIATKGVGRMTIGLPFPASSSPDIYNFMSVGNGYAISAATGVLTGTLPPSNTRILMFIKTASTTADTVMGYLEVGAPFLFDLTAVYLTDS